MGKIRNEVELWWHCLTIKQQEFICKNHLPYDNYTSLEYYQMEYLWIKDRKNYIIDIKKIRKEKIKKINSLVV